MLCKICGKDYEGDTCLNCSLDDIVAYLEPKVKKSTPKKVKKKKKK